MIGLISDSTFSMRTPRSGHGPNGHSSVISTYAGRPFGLSRDFAGRSGTGTALCVPTTATNGGQKSARERCSSFV